MLPPTLDQLQHTFRFLASCEDRGVRGVSRISASRPGPTVAISMLVHGNEPSGLAAAWYLLKEDLLCRSLLKGTVLLIVNNLEGAQRYFAADNDRVRSRCRVVEQNMNRLPEHILESDSPKLYEAARFMELYSHYQEVDAAIDLHTSSQEGESMLLTMSESAETVISGMPASRVVTNIHSVQLGLPACFFFGGKDREIPVFELESGGHEHPDSFLNAIQGSLQLLMNLDMLPREEISGSAEYTVYRVVDSIWFPDASYRLVEVFPTFSSIEKGQVLAEGDRAPILSPLDGCALLAPSSGRAYSLEEEVLFLSEPPMLLS